MSEKALRRSPPVATHLSRKNRILRVLWNTVWLLLYRPSPAPLHAWRRTLLRLFGARIGAYAHPYPKAKIWAPWNLTMAEYSCLANDTDCYCVAHVSLGRHVTVSQYSYLCTAGHDVHDPAFPLVSAPITLEDYAWVAADSFVGPGVHVGCGAVIAARSTVTRDVAAWTIVAGNPAKMIRTRTPATR